jgi:AraC family transcriptional regulator, transcriptional activator of pobA
MKPETIEQFYQRHGIDLQTVTINNAGINAPRHFNVYRRDDFTCRHFVPSNRKDYYKISLIIGKGILNYADKGIDITLNALLFSNPNIPYSWEATSEKQAGYFCLFSPDFLAEGESILQHAPMFKIGGNPLYFVDEKVVNHVSSIYEKMLEELHSPYPFKYDLLRNYVHLIIHEAMKLQPAESYYQHTNASARIASMFLELLDRQFPIDSIEHAFKLRTANDYATRLSVHVNHLNYAVKEVTGKTTTEHISSRLVQEAKALLRHTDWTISQVAYALGFEHPANFNNFFRRHTDKTPKAFRPVSVK